MRRAGGIALLTLAACSGADASGAFGVEGDAGAPAVLGEAPPDGGGKVDAEGDDAGPPGKPVNGADAAGAPDGAPLRPDAATGSPDASPTIADAGAPDVCVPKTCPALRPCGTLDDGCGHFVDCAGTCAVRDTCGAGGPPADPNACDVFLNFCAKAPAGKQTVCVGLSAAQTGYHVYCALTQIDARYCISGTYVEACGGAGYQCTLPP